MNIKVDFDNIVVREDSNDTIVKVLMLKGEKGDPGAGEENIIEEVQVNGTALTVTNKAVNVPVPTVDSTLSSSSTNPVQNNTIYNALSNKVDTSTLNNYYQISEVDDLLKEKPYCFDNVANMKTADLPEGSYVITKGYYNSNDGGHAEYVVVNNNSLTDDGASIHELSNGLFAILLINNEIYFKQLGAKPDDATFDNKTYIEKYVNICKRDNKVYKLVITPGNWYFSPTLISNFYGVNIEGVEVYSRGSTSPGVNICPLTNNQNYIWKLGGKADYTDTTTNTIADYSTEFKISGLNFTTYYQTTSYEVAQGMLIIDCLLYSNFKSIYFSQFKGNGLIFRNSWELFFDYLSFRGQWGVTNTCILVDNAFTTTGVSANVSTLDIYQIVFESTQGQYIRSMPDSGFSHNHISHINSETTLIGGTTIDSDVSSYIPIDLITGFFRNLMIDSINFIYNTPSKLVIDENTYYYRSLIGDNPDSSLTNYQKIKYITISSLSIRLGQETNNFSIMYGKDSYVDSNVSFNQIDVWLNNPNIPFYLEGSKAPYIGNYNDRSLSLSRFPNSNNICEFEELYPYANYMSIYDATLPTKLKLSSYNAGGSSTNTNVIARINKVCDSENTITVNMLVKNLASSTITCNLTYTQNGSNAFKSATIPVSNDIQIIKFQNIWFDLNSLFRLNHGPGALECIGFYIS